MSLANPDVDPSARSARPCVSAEIAHKANREHTTLRAAALARGYLDGATFDGLVRPEAMTQLR